MGAVNTLRLSTEKVTIVEGFYLKPVAFDRHNIALYNTNGHPLITPHVLEVGVLDEYLCGKKWDTDTKNIFYFLMHKGSGEVKILSSIDAYISALQEQTAQLNCPSWGYTHWRQFSNR